MTLAAWNGEITSLENLMIPALERGFLFADSVYEVCRIYHHSLWHYQAHIDRLVKGLDAIHLSYNPERITEIAQQLMESTETEHGLLYCQVTRGDLHAQTSIPSPTLMANCLMFIKPLPLNPFAATRRKGIKICLLPDRRWHRSYIKTTNLMPNVLGQMQARAQDGIEAVFLDEHDHITEGAHSNLFIVSDGTVYTPALGDRLLPGVAHQTVLELCDQLAIPHEEVPLDRLDLYAADEAFLTGTLLEIMPVGRVDEDFSFPSAPGPITQRLMATYQAAYSPSHLNEEVPLLV